MNEPSNHGPAAALLDRVWADLGIDVRFADDDTPPRHAVPLPSRLATGELAWASVRAACLASGIGTLPDPDRVAVAYRSDRALTVEGASPDVWSPYSGFFRASDGWIRTHGNYPHHATRLHAGLDLAPGADADDVREAILPLSAADAVDRITAERGLAVRVQQENPEHDATLRATPLLHVERIDLPSRGGRHDAGTRDDRAPLAGVRVLDLTRVIAGPVCTRTLALLGADVLRIDPPHLAEPEWQHLDTGHGKRSALLDARTDRFEELLASAHVVVLGYRPESLDRLGLSAAALLERHPGLLVAQLSAWGIEEPSRAGFDSLVQAESGISMIETLDGDRPGVLPAQALDHSAGYLLATAVISLLRRRRREGGGWVVRTSLRRVAAELLGMPRSSRPEAGREPALATHTSAFEVAGQTVITAASVLPGLEFTAPHRWGSDQPRW
ncbi:CoA transferase [Microbacterium sp. APC 3901]|uniref:CoA transferase n=1 Tax=Microbacterium sp. APC 3901 TaxID=3035192 RepID=UPI0025B3D3AB|nr:CoA transferase [Microbacterium sp. APC 3901]MDN3443811.1 CoA transferase [Microbacterium sp. APC 3901]